MDAKFHRDQTAKIFQFVPAARPSAGERIEPRLLSAEVVPMRADPRQPAVAAPMPSEPAVPYADFGSGWYHDVAIDKGEPSRH